MPFTVQRLVAEDVPTCVQMYVNEGCNPISRFRFRLSTSLSAARQAVRTLKLDRELMRYLKYCADMKYSLYRYFDSFQNSHSFACWPRVPAIRAFWEAMFIDEMEDASSHFIKAVDSETGEMAAFCKWVEPKPGVFPDTSLPEWPKESDVDLCNETFGVWAKQHRELMQDRGHWYLEIVGTAPKFQRKGAGSKLLQYGCERADKQGFEAFLEAAPDALRLYQKFGFRTAASMHTLIKCKEFPEGDMYTETFMIRDPKTS